ncbi:DUF3794 domain-containing protein [Selenihalanaerobacter shriftii]|uniref:SipL SPOCS domain-containing protein n=1 Tax=Selenihalanaerobacter shriftii TaxID=142842 RepID=A0A1T4N690_9FIRM|nr:DUF3794 domain-containing protein [Selenihalanaerobacter shriftii]SJZ74820.1 protein of unknown function [Selenihalanaerobacter shriftii]
MKQGGKIDNVTHTKREYTFQITEEINLPESLLQVQDFVIKLKKFNSMCCQDKLLIEGELTEKVIYQSKANAKETKIEKPTFKYFLDISNLSLDLDYKLDLEIKQFKYKLKDNNDKEQILAADIEFELKLIIFELEPSSLKVKNINSLDASSIKQSNYLKARRLILNKVLAEEVAKILIRQELDLRDEVEKVFDLNTKLINVNGEAINKKVLISGIICYQVLALTKRGEVKYLEVNKSFKETISFKNIGLDAELQIQSKVKDLEFAEENGKLKLVMVIQVSITALQAVEVSLYINPTGQYGELIKAKEEINNLEEEWMLEEELGMTEPYQKLIEIKGEVTASKTELVTDKIIISGQLLYELFYIDQNGQEKIKTFNSNFYKLLNLKGAKKGLELDYQLSVSDLQANLTKGELYIKVFLKFIGGLNRELIIQAVTNQYKGLKQSTWDYFLVDRVLKVDHEEVLVPSENYLTRYAKQIKEVKIQILKSKSKLLADSFLFSCKLKYFINFIDQNNVEQEITSIEDVYQLFTTKINNKEANIELASKLKYIDYELNDSGEKLILKTVLDCNYKILERVQLPILVKKINSSK